MVMAVLAAVFIFSGKSPVQEEKESVLPQEEVFGKIDSSVVVNVEKAGDGRRVLLTIENIPRDITDIEYDFTYDALVNVEGEDQTVSRGTSSSFEVEESDYEKEIVLGSCSANVCTYDRGVTSVKVSLRFNSTKGIKIFEKEYTL